MTGIHGVVVDIEGTTTPIAFVHRVLFPYARAHLPRLLRDRAADPAIAAELAAVRDAEPGRAPLDTLLGWMDGDVKATPLKALQGMLWREGYEDGTLKGELYADAARALAAWHAAGLRLAVYSSGSVEAQRLLFGHSSAGNLVPLFRGFYDTRIGGKREAASYRAIAAEQGGGAGLLFLSDIEQELDAAAEAGLATCQIVRPEDGTVATRRHPTAATLPEAGARFGLG